MKRVLCVALVLAAGIWMAQPNISRAVAGSDSMQKSAYTPDSIQWGPAPNFAPAGAQLAVLEGDPMATSGDYTVRMKLPARYTFPPHWHPKRENVTVISGTLKVGMGDHIMESGMASFPAGSFAYVDPDMHHYAMADSDTVIQIHGESPLQITYVNPSDDPRNKK